MELKNSFNVLFDALKKLNDFDWNKILDSFMNLPDKIQKATEKWTEYGWVPYLPEYNGLDIIENIIVPETQEDADKAMKDKVDSITFAKLIDEIKSYAKNLGQNEESVEESIKCYEAGLYSACALLTFSLIDSSLIIGQPTKGNSRRKLANKAVADAIDDDKTKYSLIAHSTKNIIENLFENPNDFSIENGLNRNMLAHGMNKYNPNEIDCLKLYVLLYNIYLLFDVEYFSWNTNP